MSVIAYGRIVKRAETGGQNFAALSADAKKENKLISGVAALVPAEILALHALVLIRTTSTSDDGTTTITDESSLKWSLIVLGVAAVAAFLIGRGFKKWGPRDSVRLVMPVAAFIAWTTLIGTSALTPWVSGVFSQGAVVLAGGVIAVILIALNAKLNPPADG